jgi:hypothetical protein
MRRDRTLFLAIALGVLIAPAPSRAEDLSAADLAWIDKCVADHKLSELDPAALRKYCACMQEIVEDNEPFTPAELEHAYPPAHATCSDESELR